jgi:hypothetical protein
MAGNSSGNGNGTGQGNDNGTDHGNGNGGSGGNGHGFDDDALIRVGMEISDPDDEGWWTPPGEEPWPEMEAEAYHGLAGQIVDTIAPLTEADPVAILAQLILMFGNAFGRQAYCRIGNTRHYPNLYEVIAGDTAKARKGTSYDLVVGLFESADPEWVRNCVKSGLSSGEGVIHAVHDDIWTREKVSGGKGNPPVYKDVLKYPSIADKRLFVIEPEFAAALTVMERHGNNLSAVLRLGWDSRKLQTMVKNNPETATDAHISVTGHITIEELRSKLDRTEMANGFANRFLLFAAQRARELPFPGLLDPAVAQRFGQKLHEILTNKSLRREVIFGPDAHDMWVAEYHDLSAPRPGLFGFLVARSEAQVRRLAMFYALLDQTYTIQPAHLRAALAVWRYSAASARYIFGDAVGDPVADDLLRVLRQAGSNGMTRTAMRELFGHHSERIGQALALLFKHGRIRRKDLFRTGGRAAEIWVAT